MKLKKIIQVLAAVLLTIAVSIGVTLAFLKSEVSEENIMTIGEVHIELLEYQRVNTDTNADDAVVEPFADGKLLVPTVVTDPSANEKFSYDVNYDSVGTSYVNWGSAENNIKTNYTSPIWNPANISNEMDKMVFVKNTGDYDAYVRLYFAFEAGNYVRFDRFTEMVHLSLNNATDADDNSIWTWEWPEEAQYNEANPKNWITDINGTRYFIATATYNKPLAPDSVTEISLSQIALDSLATNNEAAGFGSEYSVLVKAQAIQADGFTDVGAKAALDEGFGSDIPFKNMKKLTFVDLKTALHNLNGVANNTIKSKVNSVTFGLTKDYAAKVEGHEGVLVANKKSGVDENGNVTTPEADFTAYAYYVPNGENYDIYVLADGWKIYTPNSSSSLFMGMTALTTVNTANMDVSHTTKMMAMFSGCSNLVDIDVGNWDTSNVTTMMNMFLDCSKLKTLEAGTWDVSSVTTFNFMFRNCSALENIDVKNWNVSNAQSISNMFYGCSLLRVLDLSNWNTTNVTSCTSMFEGCGGLTTIYVGGGWDLPNVKLSNNSTDMFKDCTSLVGGKGTTIAKLDDVEEIEYANLINKNYARIDGGIVYDENGTIIDTTKAGYLTNIADKPANP